MTKPIRVTNMNMYQNQMNMNVFSLTIFNGKIHNESCFCIEPDAPYLWKMHFVTRGNTYTIGSYRCSCGISTKFITRKPYDKNWPSKNRFISHICNIMLIKQRASHAKYRIAYNLWRCFRKRIKKSIGKWKLDYYLWI